MRVPSIPCQSARLWHHVLVEIPIPQAGLQFQDQENLARHAGEVEARRRVSPGQLWLHRQSGVAPEWTKHADICYKRLAVGVGRWDLLLLQASAFFDLLVNASVFWIML